MPHHGNSAARTSVLTIRRPGPNDVGPARHRDVRTVGAIEPTNVPGSWSRCQGLYRVTGAKHRSHHRRSGGSGAPHARQFRAIGMSEVSADTDTQVIGGAGSMDDTPAAAASGRERSLNPWPTRRRQIHREAA